MKFCKVWDEGGRSYRLERRSNEAGRFIQSSVSPVETNFTLIFPEGRGCAGEMVHSFHEAAGSWCVIYPQGFKKSSGG